MTGSWDGSPVGKAAGQSRPEAVRVAAKAVIVRNGKLLTLKMKDRIGENLYYHSLPGGGQRPGETLPETLRRECLEEIGAVVEVGPLLYVREYIGSNHEYAHLDSAFHQVEMFFACTLDENPYTTAFNAPDQRQVDVAWLDLHRLDEYRFRPRALQERLRSLAGNEPLRPPFYLGDVN